MHEAGLKMESKLKEREQEILERSGASQQSKQSDEAHGEMKKSKKKKIPR